MSTTLEIIKNTMDTNGYSYTNIHNFQKKNDLPCYIPENGTDINDV